MSITEDMMDQSGERALMKLAAQPSHKGSGAALWVLLLLRLTSVATDQRVELRNSKQSQLPSLCLVCITNCHRCYTNPYANNIRLW